MAKIKTRAGAREAARLHATMDGHEIGGATFVLASDGRLLMKYDGTTGYKLIARRIQTDDPAARLAEAARLRRWTPDER